MTESATFYINNSNDLRNKGKKHTSNNGIFFVYKDIKVISILRPSETV